MIITVIDCHAIVVMVVGMVSLLFDRMMLVVVGILFRWHTVRHGVLLVVVRRHDCELLLYNQIFTDVGCLSSAAAAIFVVDDQSLQSNLVHKR